LVAASSSSAEFPWTVRNSAAGAVALAPCGNLIGTADPPIAIVAATRSGSSIVFSVSRNAVAPATRRTRSSTRSAALPANAGSAGYVYVPFGWENVSSPVRGSAGSRATRAPWSS
jgi:hypothetical protein